MEDKLQKSLGTKVRVFHRKKRGYIQIEYYSLDDLQKLVERLILKK